MKIEGLAWLDWLHKIRAESEAERKRRGLTGPEWLRLRRRTTQRALRRRKLKTRTPAA